MLLPINESARINLTKKKGANFCVLQIKTAEKWVDEFSHTYLPDEKIDIKSDMIQRFEKSLERKIIFTSINPQEE